VSAKADTIIHGTFQHVGKRVLGGAGRPRRRGIRRFCDHFGEPAAGASEIR